ncbi:hypothetical protein [Candidatus Berkiella aquae]|uniref:Uncharacterized protein n=2 Tax=Candidatus Berkiella aquae TaxID=295108 RepID=A0A0Q9YVV5_9GAMM|nr:hypothetical protein [Candidatus Berkiella aquae]MCS5711255.1 hypothetical protein [Candidatus Berkiella aquae]
MPDISGLQQLCLRAIKESEQQNIERLVEIKKLTKSLLKHYYEINDAQSYAKVIQTALDYVEQRKNNRLDILASLFEIKNTDMDVASYYLEEGGDGLIWNILQHHDLTQTKRSSKEIQPFLHNVAQEIGLDNHKPLAEVKSLLMNLNDSSQRNDLRKLHLYSRLFKLNIKQAFQRNEPQRVAALLKGVLPLIEKGLQLGQYELMVAIFHLDKDEIEDLYACYQNKAKALISWLLVDDLKLESYAKEMHHENSEVQAFKQAVLTNMGNEKPLKPIRQLASELDSSMARQDENALRRIDVEGFGNLVQSYLDNDVASFAEGIDTLCERVKFFYNQGDLEIITKFLDIGNEDLDELVVLLQMNDINAIRYFLIQNENIENHAFDYSTHLDGSDAARAVEFRKALYSYFAKPNELTVNQEQMNEIIATALQNPTTQNLYYVEIKISQSLQNAFQQNNVDEYLDILFKSVDIYSMLMENDISTLMMSLQLPKAKRESFLYYLQQGERNLCVAILLENDMQFHQNFKYALHQQLSDFKKRAFAKLKIDEMPELNIQTNNQSEAFHEHPNFINYWLSRVDDLSRSFDAKDTLEFNNQVKLKLQKCFRENDVIGYSDVIRLLIKYRDGCVKYHNIRGLSVVLAIDHDDIKTSIKLMNSTNRPYLEWRTVQQHELDKFCQTGLKKHAEIAPFINQVYQNLQIKLKRCFRDRTAIIADARRAIDVEEIDDLKYFIIELEGMLKQAIYSNDSLGAARTIDAIISLAQHAYEAGRLDLANNILKLHEVNDDIINQCFAEDRVNLLKLAYINDINQENIFRHIGDQDAKADLRSNIQTNLSVQTQNLFSSTNKLEKLIFDALNDQNERALKTLCYECKMMIRNAFINNDHTMFVEMIKLYARMAHKAVELRRNDFVIEQFNLDRDYVELIQLVQNHPGLPFDQNAFTNLEFFKIIQSQNLELLGLLFGIDNDKVQKFKQQAHATLLQAPKGLLLCRTFLIAEQGEALIMQPQVSRLDNQLWNAHVEAHLEHAYENADHQHFAEIISIINNLVHQSFQVGNFNLLLANIDFKANERDALFHYLQQNNKIGTFQVLTEALLRIHKENFNAKNGYHYHPDFRIKIYESLHIPPYELSLISDSRDYPAFKLIMGDEIAFEHLSWLRNTGVNINITDPHTQNVLKVLAIHDFADSAVNFLEILGTANTIQAAQLIKGLKLEHQISHRLGLTGERLVGEIPIRVEGGFQFDMISQLNIIQNIFYANPSQLDEILFNIYQQPIDSSTLAHEINDDLNAVRINDSAQTIALAQSANRIVNVPVSLETVDNSQFPWHAVNCCFFDDFCLLADRSRSGTDSPSGVRICKITKPENKDKIADELVRSNTDYMSVKDDEYEQYVTENLGLVDVGFIPMTPQTAENCTWSSCAEMMHLSTVYARLYQLGLKIGLSEQLAITKAIEGSMQIHQAFIAEDLTYLIQQYLSLKQSSQLRLEPKTLALVYLRCEHHPNQQHIAQMIKDANILQADDLTDAYHHLLNDVKNMVTLTNNKAIGQSAEFENFAKTLLDFFLHYDLPAANDCYKDFISSQPQSTLAASSSQSSVPERRRHSLSFGQANLSINNNTTAPSEDIKTPSKPIKPKY